MFLDFAVRALCMSAGRPNRKMSLATAGLRLRSAGDSVGAVGLRRGRARSSSPASVRTQGRLVELDDGEAGLHLGTTVGLLPDEAAVRPGVAGGQPP